MSYARHTYKQRREFAKPGETEEVERLLHHWPLVMRKATDDWAKGFAASVWKQSIRRGWHPSPKQMGLMRKMVRELFAQGADIENYDVQVIEE